jgi:hypothetical protein
MLDVQTPHEAAHTWRDFIHPGSRLLYTSAMNFAIEFEQGDDGRWIADRIERENSTMTDLLFAAA